MSAIVELVRKRLIENSDEKTKAGSKRYFKEQIETYGVKSAVVGQISKEIYSQITDFSKDEIFELCEELWKSGILEESFIACNWSYAVRKQFIESDFSIFERWVNHYVSNWASCDTFCNHTIGAFLQLYPQFVQKMKEWTHSPNRWVKRASAVSFILPARKGLFKEDIFDIANNLLLDTDDMVQKGYGWMLKSLADSYEDEVFQYVLSKRAVMPRTALRYAIEKMPPDKKQEAMKRV